MIIDFVGRIDGDAFEGGSQEDAPLELGSNTFLPGFEDQLVGTKAGDEVTVKVSFPEEYGVEYLAGKPAVFEVKVKEVARPADAEVNEEFANRLGFEDLAKMREAVSDRVAQEFDMVSKAQLKRQLLDKLDEVYEFDLPQRLVDQEFEQIWEQVTQRAGDSPKRPLRTKTQPKRKPARSIEALPNAVCGSDWCWARSARKAMSASATRKSTGR